MLKEDRFYTHDRFRDVFFRLNTKAKNGPDYLLHVSWFNKGSSGHAFYIGISDNFTATPAKIKEFSECDENGKLLGGLND